MMTTKESTRELLGLEKVNQHLRPPQFQRVVGNTLGKLSKQRLVLLVAAKLGKQHGAREVAKRR